MAKRRGSQRVSNPDDYPDETFEVDTPDPDESEVIDLSDVPPRDLPALPEDEEPACDPVDLLPPEQQKKVRGKVMLEALAGGLSEADGLTLSGWSQAAFDAYKIENPRFLQLVERRKVEYKKGLMMPVAAAARTDPKLASWLLERQFPEGFGARRKPLPEDRHPFAIIVNQIQNGTVGTSILPGAARLIARSAEDGL